jgi:hypothetical protein
LLPIRLPTPIFSRARYNDRSVSRTNSFQDITLKAKAGYRFSDRILLDVDLQQIAVGRDFGDFLYDARLTLSGGKKAGRIILEGHIHKTVRRRLFIRIGYLITYIFHNSFRQSENQPAYRSTTSMMPLKLDLN